MSTFLKNWFEAARFATDMQQVVTLRMMRLAAGGPLAKTECQRMVSEKVAAFGEAQGVMMAALITGTGLEAAAVKAYAPYRRTVRANSRRLRG